MTNKRTALVTGGMGGIGQAISRALHDAGHAVIVAYSPCHGDVGTWLASETSRGYRFESVQVDVADYDACQAMAETIRARGWQVDILINNAGVTRDGTFRKMLKIDWDKVMRTNLDSMFNVTRPFCEGMLGRGWGRVVNISSINGSMGQFGQTNYCASKAGIHGFTKALALEVAAKGVTVNTVSPGYIDTPMLASIPPDVMRERILTRIPMGRLGRPEEIAAMVSFLCSDAAAFITGANMAINGGQHMY